MPLPEGVPDGLSAACAVHLVLMDVRSMTTTFARGDCESMITDAFSRHAQPAKLMQLPEDLPEELPVACASRLALMSVRSQPIIFGGQAMRYY
jgi:hypothetical protein